MPKGNPKPAKNSSEFALTLITALLGVAVIVFKDATAMMVASGIAAILSAGVFAIFKTPLVAKRPGWKTKVFWTSVLTVIGSVALAVSELDIPGLPDGITRIASMITAGLSAAGYTVYRRQIKEADSNARITALAKAAEATEASAAAEANGDKP